MGVHVDVTTFPQTFAAGTWPTTAMNTGRFQITITITGSSSSFPTGNFFAIIAANDNGGFWFSKDGGGATKFGLYNATTGAVIFEAAAAWAANASITLDVNHVASTYTIAGDVTSGAGTFPFTAGGNAFSSSTLGVGVYGGGGFTWAGSASDITDGVTGYTLTAEVGVVALTGTAASLLMARRVAADAGAVAVTGTAAGLLAGYRLGAEAGTTAITGTDAVLIFGSADPYLQAEPGAVAITGTAAGLAAARVLAAELGAVAIAGQDSTLAPGKPMAAEPGAVGITGTDAALRAARALSAEAGGVAIAGTDASLVQGTALAIGDTGIDFQIYGLANRDASVVLDTQPSGSYLFVASGGKTSDVTQGVTDSNANAWNRRAGNQGTQDYPDFPGYGLVIETTAPPMTGGTAHEINVPVSLFDENTTIGIEVLGGRRVAATSWRNVANASGSTTLVADSVTVDRASVLIAICAGSGPAFSPNTTPFQLTPDAAWTPGPSYLVNNVNGEVQMASAYRVVGPGTYTCTWTLFPSQGAQMPIYAIQASAIAAADPGALAITGTDALLVFARRMTAESGAVAITGTDSTLRPGRSMAADAGAVAITGGAAGLLVAHQLSAEPGALGITGTSAALAAMRLVAANPGAVDIAGAPAALLAARRAAADAGTVAVTGTAADLRQGRGLTAEPGAVAITGADAALVSARRLMAEAGAVGVVGTNATLIWSGAGAAFLLDAEPGAVGVSGMDVTFRLGRLLGASAGAVQITGANADLLWSGASARSWAGVTATLVDASLRSTLEPS